MTIRTFLRFILIVLAAAGFAAAASANTLSLSLQPETPLQAGKPVAVKLRLTRITDNQPVTLDDLQEVHTRKLHLLIIDPSLGDYHHEHPRPTATPGEYEFSFTPRTAASYRVWADVTPVASGKQEYVRADLPGIGKARAIDKTEKLKAKAGGYSFTLAFDGPVKAGQAVMGHITVGTKDGRPFTALEPVMGAFAHIVAFGEDRASVLHVHPMGAEPDNAASRGGPELQFHFEPDRAGFTKIFAQMRIDGRDIFAPFGVFVSKPEK